MIVNGSFMDWIIETQHIFANCEYSEKPMHIKQLVPFIFG